MAYADESDTPLFAQGGTDMEPDRPRREFVKELAALGGFTAFMGYSLQPAAAEPPPEVTSIGFSLFPTTCLAPQYLAEEFLRMEGFSDVKYRAPTNLINKEDAAPVQDVWMGPAPSVISAIDNGLPGVALAGIHAGCYELFATERVRAVRDLKGKTVVIGARGALEHLFIASMVAYVGMNPEKDINWSIAGTSEKAFQQFAAGKADAWLAFGTEPLELRAKKIGHSILSTAESHPWSQYFCCMLTARREFVQKYPVASKRALRAVLKAADVCASDPARRALHG